MFLKCKEKLESYSIEWLHAFIDMRIHDFDVVEAVNNGNFYNLSKSELINDIIIPKYIEQTIEEDDTEGIADLLEGEILEFFEVEEDEFLWEEE